MAMSLAILWPLLYVGFVWWAGTALILRLNHRPEATFARSLRVGAGLAFLSLAALPLVSATPTVSAGYAAFTLALVLWGVVEMSFLMGVITGPRRIPSAGERGWPRFKAAVSTLLFHEIALLSGAACIALATLGAPNRTALWTYCVLWAMRTSAKLNLFLGVRNFSEEFLPPPLRYLASYFRRAPMNALFPVSVTAGTALAAVLVAAGLAATPGSFAYTTNLLLGTLTALAVLEHWGLVLPISLDALWRARRTQASAAPAAAGLMLVASVSGEVSRRRGR
jgi:putative photosynthetic complex assembly protein 2